MNSSHGVAIRARLIEARKGAALSQGQAAERLSTAVGKPLARQTISKWEHGKGFPNPRELAEMCSLYGVSSDWVLKGIASKPDTGCAVVDRLLGSPAPRKTRKDFEDSVK